MNSFIWNFVREKAREKGINSIDSYVKFLEINGDVLKLEVNNEETFKQLDSLKEEINYEFQTQLRSNLTIELEKKYYNLSSFKQEDYYSNMLNKLNPEFNIDSYVVGENSTFAFSVAETMISNCPKFNPLVIFGNVGLGKTHLAQAMGNRWLLEDPNKKILYITSQKYYEEILESFTKKTTRNFREIIRNADMLIVDDIQLFEKLFEKQDSIQLEFFNVFNEFILNNKPVILISDRTPNEIKNLEDRLSTRFTGGITAQISDPDKSTRTSWLIKKNKELNLGISDKLLEYISQEFPTNFRNLSGLLKEIEARKTLLDKQIDKEFIDSILEHKRRGEKEKITAEKIIKEVLKHYKGSMEDLKSNKRDSNTVRIKDATRYLLVSLLNMNYTKVANLTGSESHSTVAKMFKRINESNNKEFLDEINKIKLILENQ